MRDANTGRRWHELLGLRHTESPVSSCPDQLPVGTCYDGGPHRHRSRQMHGVVATESVEFGNVAGRPHQCGVDRDDAHLFPERLKLVLGCAHLGIVKTLTALRRCQSCARFDVADFGADDMVGLEPDPLRLGTPRHRPRA